jgi:hypothetical protein
MSSLNSHDPCLVLLCKRVAEAEAKLNATKSYFAEHRTAVLAEFTAAVDSKNLTTAQVIQDRFIVAIQDPDFDLILNRFVDPTWHSLKPRKLARLELRSLSSN